MSGFALHPDAFTDLDDIWEFIAADSVAAADRLAAEIFETLRGVTETDPTILRFSLDRCALRPAFSNTPQTAANDVVCAC